MNYYGTLRALSLAMSVALGSWTQSIPASAQKVVNFWHTEPNPKSKAAIDEIIKDFEKANPGIKVMQEAIAWGDLDKKMQAALASGAFPEIAHGQTYVERSLSAKGLLRPLNDVIESIGETTSSMVRSSTTTPGQKYCSRPPVGTDLIVYLRTSCAADSIPRRQTFASGRMLTKLTDKAKGRYG
jgi:ABC-type glycerol-3-phosphate transport system substrate-binding protein